MHLNVVAKENSKLVDYFGVRPMLVCTEHEHTNVLIYAHLTTVKEQMINVTLFALTQYLIQCPRSKIVITMLPPARTLEQHPSPTTKDFLRHS